MSGIAVYFGGSQIHWSSLIIALGTVAAAALILALYRPKNRSTTAVWLFLPLSCVYGFLLGRSLHYYFNAESYDSFISAMTDLSTGSYMLPGVLIGVGLAAVTVSALGYVSSSARLLDFAAPGLCLFLSFVRLSALFNDSCRSKIIITFPLLQRLPFAVSSTDNAGNVTWRLATFFIAFLLMLAVTGWSLSFFLRNRTLPMKFPCHQNGNVFRLSLVAYGALEIILDSTRNDSPLMHFRLLSKLNQYSAFISFAQIFGAVSALCVLVYYSCMSIRADGFSWKHPVLWLTFLASLFGIGYLGEYRVQRYGTQKYLECYGIMALSCILLFVSVYLMYRMCTEKEDYDY